MGFMQLLCQEYYWSTALLYNGNWARRMISSRNRFRAIMAFFRCNDHTAMDNDDKLRQVRYLIDNVNSPVKIFSNAARKLQLMKEWCDRSTDQVWLGYDVVMELTECKRNQGYHVYTDNFYTSPPLLRDLKQVGLLGCGTTSANRKHFPKEMKTSGAWAKKVNHGKQRWRRFDGDVLGVQWNNDKVVSMLSTIHKGSECLV